MTESGIFPYGRKDFLFFGQSPTPCSLLDFSKHDDFWPLRIILKQRFINSLYADFRP